MSSNNQKFKFVFANSVRVLFALIFIFFWYKPEIKLDLNDTYSLIGTLEKKGGRVTNYVIRIPNPHKTATDRDVYKYAWFVYGYDSFGSNNQAFCKNQSTLAILNSNQPVEILFAKNIGGILKHDYMVLEVKKEGEAVECYSKEKVLKRYHNIWLSNLHPISISLLVLGLFVIWYSKISNFVKLNRDK